MEKWGSLRKNKFFINNSVEALILFNEKHQSLLKLHVPLGYGWQGSSEHWGKKRLSPEEGILFEMEK